MPNRKRARRRRRKPPPEDTLAMIDRHLLTRIKSTRNGKVVYITAFEAIILQLQKSELEGDAHASRVLLKYEDLSKHVAEKQVELNFIEDTYTRSLTDENSDE